MSEPVPEFEARWPGICQHGDPIRAGDLVRYSGGELEHVNCRDPQVKPTRFEGSTDEQMGF